MEIKNLERAAEMHKEIERLKELKENIEVPENRLSLNDTVQVIEELDEKFKQPIIKEIQKEIKKLEEEVKKL